MENESAFVLRAEPDQLQIIRQFRIHVGIELVADIVDAVLRHLFCVCTVGSKDRFCVLPHFPGFFGIFPAGAAFLKMLCQQFILFRSQFTGKPVCDPLFIFSAIHSAHSDPAQYSRNFSMAR